MGFEIFFKDLLFVMSPDRIIDIWSTILLYIVTTWFQSTFNCNLRGKNTLNFNLSPYKMRLLYFFSNLIPRSPCNYTFYKSGIISFANKYLNLGLVFSRKLNNLLIRITNPPDKIPIIVRLKRRLKFLTLRNRILHNRSIHHHFRVFILLRGSNSRQSSCCTNNLCG